MKKLTLTCIMISACVQAQPFSFKDTAGEHLDILRDGKPLVRYMYSYDADRREETYKPYHHVMDADGQQTITKGHGGKFTHHRAIYIGWNSLGHNGKNSDLWHMKGKAMQLHKEILKQEVNDTESVLATKIHWITDAEQEVAIEEVRSVTIQHDDKDAHLVLDFKSELKAINGDVTLKGDPEHSGFQYRPHNDVTGNKSSMYTFHAEGADPRKDRNLPWVANTYELRGETYTVQHMNHPDNPEGWIYSAYRDYGRFGSTFYTTIKNGEVLSLNYRIRITTGDALSRSVLSKHYATYIQ